MVNLRDEIRRNIDSVREKISSAAAKSGRNPEDILLMGVSKFQPLESIYAARDCGLALFGENRVQEREEKAERWEGPRAECHMIGHLQKNKVRRALKLFDCVESVDSAEIALAAERVMRERPETAALPERPYPIMIEINVSEEGTKHGISPEKSFTLIDDIAVKCPHIEIKGLMTIGPLTDDEKRIGASFETLRKLRDDAQRRSGLVLTHLSMGMSGDYSTAIAEGSTIVRIGSAIFGERDR
ncbi:MAG: YggS family pyridoxal phosphate-dependent enzyme [Synergistaceae bacterium]|jgi:pyridoxal phosphate enzyme (YggS family)|nr:YggS family pyridoxal phosphate-dependent enzyme [Synergistaceae bacterium]